MSSEPGQSEDPPNNLAAELFQTTRLRIANVSAAKQFWHMRLNATERQLLGGTFDGALKLHGNAAHMWEFLRQVTYQRAVIEVAESLGFLVAQDVDSLLMATGELPRDAEIAKDQAIQRGDLVLDTQSQSLHWRGEECEVEWTHLSWNFFLTACRQAKRNEAIDRFSFGESVRENFVTQAKNRLKNLDGFPAELIGFFKIVGRGTQRFDFPRQHIFIAEP